MDTYAVRLAQLVSIADAAYQRARAEIYDALPVGARIDVDALDPRQRDAFEDLIIAEAELANFRHSHREAAGSHPELMVFHQV
jgi:hypothetical protein